MPLWVKSSGSFLEGASHPEELVQRAAALRLPGIALTDRDGLYAATHAHVAIRDLKRSSRAIADCPQPLVAPKLILGAQVSVSRTRTTPLPSLVGKALLEDHDQVLLLAQNREGYGNLCRLLTCGHRRAPKGRSLVSYEEVSQRSRGLVCVTPSPESLPRLHDAFDQRLYGICTRHRYEDEGAREFALRKAAKKLSVPLVGGSEVLYHGAERRALQDVLTCIRHGVPLSQGRRLLRGNNQHALLSPAEMARLFADSPELLTRTLEVAERCSFSLDELRYVYPEEHVPRGRDEHEWLRELTYRGARHRYGVVIPAEVHAQLDRELTLIHELQYGGYFLTMWEIVQFCEREQILCQGRGSAANSVVCFCLGITAIDPVKMDLLFERFISKERAEPPDIDLDIEHQRREEVIQWVYQRYGRHRAAMVANLVRYRPKSAIRDVGKVLGIENVTLDRMAKLLGHHLDDDDKARFEQAGFDARRPAHRHLLSLVKEIQDFPRHLSIHPGGFLLGHERIDEMVPVEPATMEDRTVIQWDKYDVENLGLFKVDLLGLGALTHLHRTFDLIDRYEGKTLSMASIPHDDPSTFEMVSRGETVGVFQIESRAQMAMLPRMNPRCFYDLVIEIALVRPGPIQGDMVHPYLRRRRGEEPVEYPHPDVKRVLSRTLGVPIFQEQVMKLAVVAAGYTPGEADQLRRDMAAWRSSGRIEAHRDRLTTRMIQRGISAEFAERVFSQIRGFGEYGFPESHAASFALIAYATAYLRAHYPASFAAGLLNAQPMGFYSPSTIIEDIKRKGVDVRPVCVQKSQWDCTLERDHDTHPWSVRGGLRQIHGLGARERALLEQQLPPATNLEEFVTSTQLSKRALLSLAEAGALECFGLERRDANWKIRGLLPRKNDTLTLPRADDKSSFTPLSLSEEIVWDYRASAHSTRGHPMQVVRPQLQALSLPDASHLSSMPNAQRVRYVGMVICRQQPSSASGVTFYTLEDETGFVNVVVWKQVYQRHRLLARTSRILGVTGRIQVGDGVVHLIAEELWSPPVHAQTETPKSRDFH